MWTELIALLSSMGWAADAILVRKGARTSHVFSAAFLSFLLTTVCLWAYISVSLPLHLLRTPASLYFVLSGCLQPLLARLLHYAGITRLGVSRAGPLRGVSPLLAVFLAVLFLNEHPNSYVYGGGILTVMGVSLILLGPGEKREWKLFDLVFPLGAALTAAISQVLRRTGLLLLPNPFVGAAVTTSTSLTLFLISLLLTGKIRMVVPHRSSLPYFGTSAFVSAASQFLAFLALSGGEVSVVAPLINTTPFFAVLFSAVFLRDLERVTLRLFFGAVVLVLGVVLIAIG